MAKRLYYQHWCYNWSQVVHFEAEEKVMNIIYGIGHDIIEIGRITAILERSTGQAFMRRVLTDAERTLAEQRAARLAEFVAGRFAAKEAISKAFGCGIGGKLSFTDISILPAEGGRPVVCISDEAWHRLGLQEQQHTVHISITHQPAMASAFAVVERVTTT